MDYTLLAGGYRPRLVHLILSDAGLRVERETPTPPNPSWVERAGDKIVAVSEEDPDGEVVFLEHDGGLPGLRELRVVRRVKTGGAPCHVLVGEDEVLISNYMSGTVTIHSLSTFEKLHTIPLPYAYAGTAPPHPARQEGAHAHHALRTPRGVWVADLGSDRVYLVDNRQVVDWIQCEPGFGPRHCALSPDGSIIYVLGELAHAVVAYPASATRHTPPIAGSRAEVPPPGVRDGARGMDSAEIVARGGEVWASNRGELHEHGAGTQATQPPSGERGESVAVISYDKGEAVGVRHVRTGLCCIRGMAPSPDGRLVALAGQCAGGVEVWDAHEWRRVARVDVEGVTDFVWL